MLASRRKTILFASKALTDAQQGYVAIELESLAAAWAMKKFHHFLYASHLILETDQKPRLQSVLIRTFLYYFTVRFIPGFIN